MIYNKKRQHIVDVGSAQESSGTSLASVATPSLGALLEQTLKLTEQTQAEVGLPPPIAQA